MGEIAKTVLNNEESNFVAAMTLGVTLAEVNKLSEAKDVFNMIQESCHHNKNIILNNAQLEILNVCGLFVFTDINREDLILQLLPLIII